MNHIALFRSLSPLALALLVAAPGCVAAADETQADSLAEDALAPGGAETESAAAELAATAAPHAVEDGAELLTAGADADALLSASTLIGLSTGFYVPPHVGGDAEYNGHGPSVSLQVELSVFNGNELWAAVTMDALETKSDWTRAAGTAWYRIHTASRPIVDVSSPTYFSHAYTDTDHAHDIFSFAPESLVNKLDYVGDTRGSDAGRDTGVRVYFNPITIVTE
ncbi:uncharacterized protein SOCE26_009880 [Sorangium cellulosum]|uniref:Secreted protein n=1 Tax=Sorangium cellulosum TaxID=56 RepID=A0A2L0EK01_SORCE|nr:hypothetical protein [Sorangium cellulosum]AUX39594.1 uncharacterized protein SOCE26_009880 [Sorangium cellulosum]